MGAEYTLQKGGPPSTAQGTDKSTSKLNHCLNIDDGRTPWLTKRQCKDWRTLHNAPHLNGNHTPLVLKNISTIKYGTASLLLLHGKREKKTTFIACLCLGVLEKVVFCGMGFYRSLKKRNARLVTELRPVMNREHAGAIDSNLFSIDKTFTMSPSYEGHRRFRRGNKKGAINLF